MTLVSVEIYDLTAPFDDASLSAQERARVERFHRPESARKWAAGRAGLRRLLGQALDIDASDVELARGPQGKPEVVDSTLRFNKSDTGDFAAVALCRGREVGLDIEQHREVRYAARIVSRFLSADERTELAGLAEPAGRRAFFDCWTVKEAVLKCDGGGLGAIPMSSFSAPLDPRWSGAVGDRWWAARIDCDADLSAAVVLEGRVPADLAVTFPKADGAARG